MILSRGKILPPEQTGETLAHLPGWIAEACAAGHPDPECVIAACDTLARRVAAGEYDDAVKLMLVDGIAARKQIDQATAFFCRENLEFKLKTELGAEQFPVRETPPGTPFAIERRLAPLGVLMHIAAGNVDALPAYSVIEGLLAGNINLLKLPQSDAGLSVLLRAALTEIEPRLLAYIYVFDTPSSDLETLQRLANLADGIVVWGGDDAVQAVRRMASLNARVIEWGHKLSFAYATMEASDEALAGLARQIVSTRQLLCSSCQGIFVDTEDMGTLFRFCERFEPILDREAEAFPPPDIGTQAQITLLQYTAWLEGQTGTRLFSGKRTSVTAGQDSTLELSLTCGNCWAKRLPRRKLVSVLRPYKGYLQTAGLLCAPSDWETLSGLLRYTGVCRIRRGEHMSLPMAGEAHDGEFALRRYMKIIETEVL